VAVGCVLSRDWTLLAAWSLIGITGLFDVAPLPLAPRTSYSMRVAVSVVAIVIIVMHFLLRWI